MIALYLLDKPVYDITGNNILNYNLLPTMMKTDNVEVLPNLFWLWYRRRNASSTNSEARSLRRLKGDRNELLNDHYHLSLSDSYWIKDSSNNITFAETSPYFNQFWQGATDYDNSAVPTLKVTGARTKKWISSKTMMKAYNEEELLVSDLLTKLDIAHAKCKRCRDKRFIEIENITTSSLMLEEMDKTGLIPENFEFEDVIKAFPKYEYQIRRMIFIDTIVANPDRHWVNFGHLRSTSTGESICFAPLYDFDYALYTKSESNAQFAETLYYCSSPEFISIAEQILTLDTLDVFKRRAQVFLKGVHDEAIL